MRVLFWGTPEFATPPLRALLGEGFDVCGVVTQPDRPRGRHRAVSPSPVKQIALDEHLSVLQPASPRDAGFVRDVEELRPDISVVVAYGHILPQRVIDLPHLGTLNIHASLLPALRGAAPIQAAIRQGLHETGVTIMRMVQALDAGPIVLQSRTPIADDETGGELRVRLSELGALALIEALALIDIGEAHETPQNEALATYAPKLTRETVRVPWASGAREVANTVRAYDPAPGAFTTLLGTDVKLFGAKAIGAIPGREPGEVLETGETLVVACGDGAVTIGDVQPAGKRRMTASAWHRGRGVAVGDRFV